MIFFIFSNNSDCFISYKIDEHSALREYDFLSFTIYMQ